MINRKGKGSRWEREIIHLLERMGYKCTRAAGSMGIWDIIAVGELDCMLVQAKCNSKGTKKERDEMKAFECPGSMSKEIWIKYDNQPAPLIEYYDWGTGDWDIDPIYNARLQYALQDMREEKRRKK